MAVFAILQRIRSSRSVGDAVSSRFHPFSDCHNGVSAESTVLLADDELKQAIRADYPDMWKRIESRRAYLRDELGIQLPEDVLPMAGTLAYYRPYMLNNEYALTIEI